MLFGRVLFKLLKFNGVTTEAGWQDSVITGVIFARFSLQTLSAKFTKWRVIAAFALMASFAGEVLISATSGVFAHKPPIGLENAKENGTDQIVVIVIVMVVVAMVVGVVSSPIWAPTSTWPWWSSLAWRSWEERQRWSCGGYIKDRPQSAQCAGLHLRPGEGPVTGFDGRRKSGRN
jgi:hypothetical protein